MTNLCANGLYHFWFKMQEKGRRPLQILRDLRAGPTRNPVHTKPVEKSYMEVDDVPDKESSKGIAC
jgi:hypothetical protein